MTTQTIRDAYDRTDFEMVATGANEKYEVPMSTPGVFEFADPDEVRHGADVQNAIETGEYTTISPYLDDKRDGRYYLSTKVLASETNEFFHVKATRHGVRVFPKDEEFSFETFRSFVEHLEDELGAELIPTDPEE